jgi:glycosyltransferase involved in cell wall biosynthesis
MTTRVLQVVHGLGMGGAETWLMSLLDFFGRSGDIEISFLMTGGERRVFDDEARKRGARLHYIAYNRSQALRFGQAFRALLATDRYDAVHNHQGAQSGFHFSLAGRTMPPVRIAHVHNPTYQLWANGASPLRRLKIAAAKQLVRRYATHILGTSAQLIREYGFSEPAFDHLSRGPLHCGFDSSRFKGDRHARVAVRHEFGWPESVRVVLFAGRLDYDPEFGAALNHKNSGFAVDTLIQAMRHRDDLVALFAGAPSPALPVLEERVVAAGLAGRIVFAGVRHDLPRLMQASDALFFPSRAEGLGMVAVEAQAAGLPVLASTAVLRECVVVPELVRFLDLAEPYHVWVDALNATIDTQTDRDAANALVAASAFDIRQSAAALAHLYRTGELKVSVGDEQQVAAGADLDRTTRVSAQDRR